MMSGGLPSLIGVIHLPPLPGSPGALDFSAAEALERAGLKALEEAKLLEKSGFHALILENFGDVPFYSNRVPAETVSALSIIAAAVREAVRIPMGINVLRNDVDAALAIASVTRSAFVRANVLGGVAATDQGWVEGCAAEWIRKRKTLKSDVKIFADAHVKHAVTFSSEDPAQAVEDLAHRSLADAVIISGSGTGKPVDQERLKSCATRAASYGIPLYIGSGVTRDRLKVLQGLVSGVIVSSALRKNQVPGAPLVPKQVSDLAKDFQRIFKVGKKKAQSKIRR